MKLTVSGGEHVRVGTEYPFCVDVWGLESACGIAVGFFRYKTTGVKLLRKGIEYLLWMPQFPDQQLPDEYQDAEVLWELPSYKQAAGGMK